MNSAPLIFQLLLLVLILAYITLLIKSKLQPRIIRRAALVILIAGTALNMYGLSLEDFSEGWITLFFRSMFLTIKMFVYDGDLIDLTHGQHTYLFLELYFFVFYAAMLTSISAILMLFGKRVTTAFTLLFRKKKFHHIFIGVNKRSAMIAQGIEDKDIAFIEFPSDNRDHEFSVGQLISGMVNDESREGYISGRGIAYLAAKRRFKIGDTCNNIFATIGLDKLKKLTDRETAFYILSENADSNLQELMALLSDEDLTNNTIHVCLSREGVARYYKTTMKRTGVHFIYPSSMSVVELMKTPKCHPSSLFKPQLDADGKATGAVSGEFNAMVIGFGETGQAVTKFLYEFSAAVDIDGSPIPASITVCDDNVDRLKGIFLFDNPDMANSEILHYDSKGTESEEFWDGIINNLDRLNYIAISLNDDASSLELACTIFMYAMKKRQNGLDGIKIIVRKRSTLPHERKLVDKINEKAGHEVIICYGEYEKIFTTDMIVSKQQNGINKQATGLADKIADEYRKVSGREVIFQTDNTDSFHTRNHIRMELHQLISRANHASSILQCTDGQTELSDTAMENLAKMEHLRFSRYLVAHGYSFAKDDDDVFKTNHQICSWDNLTDDDRQYHRDMVRAQLNIS